MTAMVGVKLLIRPFLQLEKNSRQELGLENQKIFTEE